MHRFGRRVHRVLGALMPDAPDGCSEDAFCALVESVAVAERRLDFYLVARGGNGPLRARVRPQPDLVAEALGCIRRGYAPGALPTVSERPAPGEARLRQVVEP